MAFAKDYKEEITLAYYCFSLALTIAALTFGTIYLWHKDRRDQQRREWRQLTERIYSDYTKLKDKDIPRKISKVRDTFQKIQMKSTITGLDVLRYMLADENYERCKTSQLESLRDDMHSIYQLFNVCSSLLLLGKVPKNIKQELKDVVTELGNIVVPFFKGEQRKIILKCLEHFGSGRPKAETERRTRDLDARLETAIPYANSCLRLGDRLGAFDTSKASLNLLSKFHNPGERDYSKLSDFFIYVGMDRLVIGTNQFDPELDLLTNLQSTLQDPKYKPDFRLELQGNPVPLQFDEQLNGYDEQEPVLVKVLHKVRVYIHLCLNNQLEEHDQVEQIRDNMRRLREVKDRITRIMGIADVVQNFCKQFKDDLDSCLQQTGHSHCNTRVFCDRICQLFQTTLEKIQNVSESVRNDTQHGNDKNQA